MSVTFSYLKTGRENKIEETSYLSLFVGAPEEIRTPDPQIRSQMLFTSSRPRTAPRVVAVRFVPRIVPRDGFCCQESWSEWQDLNLRPHRPERGGAQHDRWGSPLGFYI